jgi:hypothetical protein
MNLGWALARLLFYETLSAVNWPPLAGFEWQFGCVAALGAGGREALTLASHSASAAFVLF